MRFVLKLFLGMIILQAFLFLFTSPDLFNLQTTGPSIDINNSNITGYKPESTQFAWGIILNAGGIVSAAIILGAGLLAIFTKNVIWFGAGAISAILFGLWNGFSSSLNGMFNSYPEARYIWTMINILTGFLMVILVVELFTGRGVDD